MGIRDYIKYKKASIKQGLEVRKEEKLADRARARMAKSQAREKARQEDARQRIATAEYESKLRGAKKREYIKQGGFFGAVKSNLRTARSQVQENKGKSPWSLNKINMGPSRNIMTGKTYQQPRPKKKKKSKRSITINL